jgi:allantoin racemase
VHRGLAVARHRGIVLALLGRVRILLANPNSTESLTQACAALAQRAASPGTRIESWSNFEGPPTVDSMYADYMAGRPLALALAALSPPPDAVVLGGFGNYGTGAVKEALAVPVVSMAEAAMGMAVPLCHRFAIVTTAARMIPYTEDVVQLAGFASRCAAVRAVELPPIGEGSLDERRVLDGLGAVISSVTGDTGADLVILGGARLSPYAAAARERSRAPILEPISCGVAMAEALVRLGLAQSKAGKFAAPPRDLKEYE